MRYYTSYLFTIVCILISNVLMFAQFANLKFNHIGLEEGLSQSCVFSIAQDSEGFLWFGTQDGLDRYDGYSITAFKHNPIDSSNKKIVQSTLTDNYIANLICDADGNLWIGTDENGIDLYVIGQNKFYHFNHISDDSLTLSDNRITFFYKDRENNIWIGTYNGLNIFNPKTKTFRHYFFIAGDISKTNPVTSMCEDSNNNYWVGTALGLYKFQLNDINSTEKYSTYFTKPVLFKDENVTAVFFDHSDALWIGMLNSPLRKVDIKSLSVIEYKNCGKAIQCIYEDSAENLWLGSAYSSGLSILFKDNSSADMAEKKAIQIQGIPNDIITSIFKNKTGIIWIGTYFHGVYSYDKQNNRFRNYLSDPQNPNVVMSVLQDYSGSVWAGTFGNGLKCIDMKNDKTTTYNVNPASSNSITSSRIISLYQSKDSIIWIGTYGGGLVSFNKSTGRFKHYIRKSPASPGNIYVNDVTALFEDREGNMWIGSLLGDVDCFKRKENKFVHFHRGINKPGAIFGTVASIRQDDKGEIWIASLAGLFKFLPASNSFKRYILNNSSDKKNLSGEIKRLQSIFIKNGVIWIGTAENGLLRFDKKSESIKQFTTKDGLSNNVVYGILSDESGNLWMSTNNGISGFNPGTGKFRNFNINDGLQSNEFNQGAYYKGLNGELFFGGVNGFNAFFPYEIEINKNVPPVYLTSFKVFDKSLNLPDPVFNTRKINLSYSQNFFSFDFVALNYTSPEKNQYAYKLNGFDKNWHNVSAQQRYASYTNVDPGEYTLMIKASNNDGIWNEQGASVVIVISPPFWMTWWFRTLFIVLIVSAVVLFYNYRVRKIRMLDLMRLRIARDLHDEVGSDLGGITLMSQRIQKYNNIPVSVAEELKEINQAVFQTSEKLRDIVWFVNPEHDNSEQLVLRLKDLAGRLLKDVEYNFKVDENINLQNFSLETRRQIYLIVKEILHNIVQHANATKVDISIKKYQKIMKISICDNGVGIKTASSLNKEKDIKRGMGLKNIKQRAELIGSEIETTDNGNSGTSVTLSINIP
jgi:ligand-binding sensor domain-containing protein/anti-sigma regulatory factor (Ser/Thr protein kinase)